MSHPALTQLRALRYFAAMPPLEPSLRDWLLLEDSMTKRCLANLSAPCMSDKRSLTLLNTLMA